MTPSRSFQVAYYLVGTVAFAALDWILAAPIRATFLDRPQQRLVYYVALLGLGLLCRAKRQWAPLVGLGESAVNLFLVIASIMLPVFSLVDAVDAGGPMTLPFTTWTLLNVLITGSVLIVSFQQNQRALMSRGRDRRR